MTVIIRLQNLPWSANALDIRRFFQGLAIPDGGVHIVGGEKGDAFIAFSTDDDARQAMYMDNGRLCDSQVKLLLSSKTEMQNVIAVARGSSNNPAPSAGPGREPLHKPATNMGPGHMGGAGGIEASDRGRMGSFGKQSVGMPMEDHPVDKGSRGGDGYMHQGPVDRSGSGGRPEGPRMGGVAPRPVQAVPKPEPRGDWKSGGYDRPSVDSREGGGYNRMRDEGNRPAPSDRSRGDRFGGDSAPVEGGPDWRRSASAQGGQFNAEPPRDKPPPGGRGQGYRHRPDRSEGDHALHPPRRGGDDHYGQAGGPEDFRRGGESDRYGVRDGRGSVPDDRDHNNVQDYHDRPEPFNNRRAPLMPSPRHSGRPRQDPERDHHEYPPQDFNRDYDHQEPRGYDQGNNEFEDEWGDQRGRTWSASYDRPSDRYEETNDTRYEERRFDHGDDYRYEHVQEEFVDDGYDASYETSRYDEYPYHENEHGDQGYDHEDNYGQQSDYSGDFRDGQDFRGSGQYRRDDFIRPGRDKHHERFDEFRGRGRGGGFRARGRGRGRGSFSERRAGFDERKRRGGANRFVYLSNMGESVSYKEVRRFFRGLDVPADGLKVINDRHGNRIGTAYVAFGSEADCEQGLRLNGQMMGNKKVQIERCQESDFEKAIDSYLPSNGTPYRSSSPPKKRFRSRSPMGRAPHRDVKHDGSNCIEMNNVHYRATRLDVRNFLGKLKIHTDGGPHIILGKDGRPTGKVYVQLDSKADFDEALTLHSKPLLRRNVEITPLTKKDFDQKGVDSKPEENAQKPGAESKQTDTNVKKGHSDTGNNSNSDKNYFCVKMRGLPFSATSSSIREFFGDLRVANRGIYLVTNPQGQASGVAFVEFVTSADCNKAMEKDKHYMGKRYIELLTLSKKDMLEEYEMEKSKVSSGPGRPSSGGRHTIKNLPELPGISRPGCTITMSNLPYKVQLEDIMSFLGSCHPIQDSVRLRYSKDGKPTGDAMVTFRSPDDAHRALNEFNRQPMMGRLVALAMAP